jgi:TetR/AcrR family transcriptional regulator, regulator of autoinduction and epiphytic fitness
VQVVDKLPALLEVALVKPTGCHDDEHATRLECLEGVRRGSGHMQEITGAEPDVLLTELEAVATLEDEDGFLVVVAVERNATTGDAARLEQRVVPLSLGRQGFEQVQVAARADDLPWSACSRCGRRSDAVIDMAANLRQANPDLLMPRSVKPPRRYRSPHRQQQAQATRQQIVDAAGRLFGRDGYFGTTIETVAQEAGVAVPTVYAAFGSKRAILSALVDSAIFGTDPPGAPVGERSWYPVIAAEFNPARLLRRWAEYLCEVNARVAPVQRVVQSAASSDPEIAGLWQRMKDQRLVGQTAIAQLLAERTVLRAGVNSGQAADTLYVLSDAHLYDAYVHDRGWSPAQLSHWLEDAFCSLSLR